MEKKILCLILSCSFLITTNGQQRPNEIEIASYLNLDSYPLFTFPFNTVRNNSVKLKGTSWGTAASYKFSLKNNFFVKFGAGYYRFSFNEIEKNDPLFGSRPVRDIKYPGGSSTFAYVCDKYWYNTLPINIGIEKFYTFKKNVEFVGGFDIINYFTISQNYNIPGSNNSQLYKEATNRYFALSLNMHAGIQQTLGNISISPALIVPFFKRWKQDRVFPQEENKLSRSKWLRGIGVSIAAIFSLPTIKKLRYPEFVTQDSQQ